MRHTHSLLRVFAFFVTSLMVRCYAMSQNRPSCDSIATPGTVQWFDSNSDGWGAPGVFVLQQTANGTLAGTYTPPETNFCPDTFILSGSTRGDGEFYVSGADNARPMSPYCASSFHGTVTVSGSGCAKGTVQWQNSSGQHGDDTLSDAPGVLPTGETTPLPLGQVAGFPALLQFWQNIAPTTYDFQGRLVNESFPAGFTDSCTKNPNTPQVTNLVVAGNTYPLVNGSTNGGLPIDGVTTGYGDNIGLQDTQLIDTIRTLGDAPCTLISANQLMTIDTAGNTYQYQTNVIIYSVGQTSVTAERGNPPTTQTVDLLTLDANIMPAVNAAVVLTLLKVH